MLTCDPVKNRANRCLLSLLLVSKAALGGTWGVIASTYDTLRETQMISDRSLNEALQEAAQLCRKQTPGQDCFAVANVLDGCIAWAVDRRGHWGWAQLSGPRPNAEGIEALEKKAVEQCLQDPDAGRCRAVSTLCTDDKDS